MTGPWWTSTISDPLGSIRILKKANCPTLSGKSKLTYHIGCTTDSKIFLRIHANDGGGLFSQEWVAWKEIQQVLSKVPKDNPITAVVLYRLFKGKSVNTPAFLLAVLKHEKLIQTVKGKKRSHELTDPKAFLARMDKLMASSATSKATGTARKTAKKARATAINRVFQQNWN
jgi:hypothetical protein